MILNVSCPRCTALLDVTPDWLGQPIECGGCSSVFTCPEIAEEAPPDDGPKTLREKGTRRDSRRSRDRDDPEDDRWAGYEAYSQDDDPDSYIAKKRGPGYATASLVIGILALTLGTPTSFFSCGFGGFIQMIMGLVGLIFGYIGLRSDARGNAIAGMVMNVLSLLIAVILMSFMGWCLTMKPFGAAAPPPPTQPTTTIATWKSNQPPQKAK